MSPRAAALGTLLILSAAGTPTITAQPPHQHEPPPAHQHEPPAVEPREEIPAGVAGDEPLDPRPLAPLAELETGLLERDPDLLAARAELEAARGRARQAGLWPNPVIGALAEEVPFDGEDEGGRYGGFVAQRIPLGGKLGLDRRVAEAEVRGLEAELEAARLAAVSRLRRLYLLAAAAELRAGIYDERIELAREAVEVTAQLYNVGAADLSDQLAIEIETEETELEAAAARREAERLRRALAVVTGSPAVAEARLEELTVLPLPRLDRDEQWRRWQETHPRLAAARAAAAGAELGLRRERRQTVPDLELEAGIVDDTAERFEGGPEEGSEWFAQVGVELPVFDRNRGAVAAATAELDAARRRAESVELSLATRFDDAWSRYESAAEAAERYARVIVPKARRAHRLYLDRYLEMAAAYPQVLISRRTYTLARLEQIRALTEAHLAAVALEGLGTVVEEPEP